MIVEYICIASCAPANRNDIYDGRNKTSWSSAQDRTTILRPKMYHSCCCTVFLVILTGTGDVVVGAFSH